MTRKMVAVAIVWGVLLALGWAAAEAAGGQVPEPIAGVATSYANALAAGNLSQAWDLLSSPSRAATPVVQWQQAFERRPPMRKPPATSLLRAMAASTPPPAVGDVLVAPDEALVEVSGVVQVPQQIVLVKEAVGWRVDLAATDQLNSRRAAADFIEMLREETAISQRQGMRAPMQEVSYPLLRALLAGEATSYKAIEAQVSGDRAQVTVAAEIPVHLVLRAARSGPGWAVDLTRPVVPIDVSAPDPLQQAVALSERMKCEEQMSQLVRAIQMYATVSEDMVPDPARWFDQVRAFLPAPGPAQAQGHCPSDSVAGISYAMNRNLAGKRLHQIANPGTTPLLYESAGHGGNPAGVGENWPTPLRHPEGNLVAFADGSVRPMTQPPSFQVAEAPPGAVRGGVVLPGRGPGRPPVGQPVPGGMVGPGVRPVPVPQPSQPPKAPPPQPANPRQ